MVNRVLFLIGVLFMIKSLSGDGTIGSRVSIIFKQEFVRRFVVGEDMAWGAKGVRRG
jgi:hypothetical protein